MFFSRWEADLFVLLALHFSPCLPCHKLPFFKFCICYGHVKQKLSHVGAHHLLILPKEKEVPCVSS